MFSLLFMLVTILVYQIAKKRLYLSSIMIFNWFSINCFFTPAIYYSLLNGEKYKRFSEDTYSVYLIIGIIYLTEIILLNFIYTKIRRNRINVINFIFVKNISKLYMCICLVSVFAFICMFGERLPLIQAFFFESPVGDLSRPDVSGSIPHYFSINTWVTITIPMIYLYFRDNYSMGKILGFVFLLMVFLSLLMGGNKSSLFYFMIFMWIYCWKFKMNCKVIFFGLFSIFIY